MTQQSLARSLEGALGMMPVTPKPWKIPIVPAVAEAVAARARREDRSNREALEEIRSWIALIPGGIEVDADPEDPSPRDGAQHIAGVIWQICERALGEEK